jgi:steroid 5-alpha reductase family enzyme
MVHMNYLDLTLLTTGSIYAMVVLAIVTIIFLVAQLKRDNSIMDVCYGPIFALSYWATWYLTGMATGVALLLGALVTLWAARLGWRIGRKNWGKPEDPRYAAWRSAWTEQGVVYFIVRSYLQVNLLQGFIIFLVASPLWWSLAQPTLALPWLVAVGVIIMLFGFGYEATADAQLDRFLARKRAGTEQAILMQTGLFARSRRPNYFGEALIWWGFFVAALGVSLTAWPTIIGPLVITYILTKVTGPMLENYFLDRYPDEYQAYMDSTPYFIPRFGSKA